jgi:hypothetical protein
MDGELLTILIALVALAIVGAIAVAVTRNRNRQRSRELREHFGPEYERALEQHGDRSRAERDLWKRQRRVQKLHIQLLAPEQCESFSAAWSNVQQRFVDDPSSAVVQADRLVKEVMSARGYPMGNFEQRVADLSVEHGNVIEHYRAARDIALMNADGRAGTEELRQAMVHYRALFTDLLQSHAPQGALREAPVG